MNRRGFLTGLGSASLLVPVRGATQPAGKLSRIGFLVMARNPGVEDAFPRGLRELGYIEGRDVIVEWRSADGRNDRMPALTAEMVGRGVDVIVAGGPEARKAAMEATSTIPIVVVDVIVTHGTPGTRALKEATTAIPIVMAVSGDAVSTGLIASLARPGGNITGSTFFNPEISAKRLELLKAAVPRLARVAVLLNPDNPVHRVDLEVMEQSLLLRADQIIQ